MGELTLLSDYCLDTTVLSNVYIDEYMASNNEAQIKIYLFLLRKLGSGSSVSVCLIADVFNYTIQDVERALFFMEKQGLMTLDVSDNKITGIKILPLIRKSNEVIMFEANPQYSKEEIIDFAKLPEAEDLIFAAEQYLGRIITQDDIQKLYYMNKTLGLNEDVIDYLMGYCISIKKKSFGYMSKVAKEWAEAGVKTVKDAKNLINDCPKEVYDIFNSFGMKGGSRKPTESEKKYTRMWCNDYGFSMDIIDAACKRTIEKTHSVSFEYADAILKDWKTKNVKHIEDIAKLDEEFSNKYAKKSSSKINAASKSKKDNKFTGYSQRDYNFDDLEKQMLSN